MKHNILLFLLLIPAFLFAQYPNTGNKARLGYQTTGDGLIWRGVAADTVLKPRVIAHAYFQLDTVNGVLRRYIATNGSWQVVGGGSDTDSTVYATRYWTSSNFFPLEGGTLTGTGGAGFIGLPDQVTAASTPASGLNIYAQGSSFNFKGTDGFERQFGGTITGGRSYILPDVNGTLALGTGTTDRSARWSGTNTLAAGNITDNGTKLEALKPWQFNSSSLAGLPTGVSRYIMDISDYDWFARYSSTAGAWVPPLQASSTGLPGGKGTAGSLLFLDANGRGTQDNANLFWNNSTKRLGIGTNTPSQAVEIYTPTTTSVNLLKLQTATHPVANILFNMNGFQGTISAHLLSLASTQGTAPSIYMANNQITASFSTASTSNNINLRANTLVGGSFGFLFTSNVERKYYVMQQDASYIGGFDVGVNFATYDHRNTIGTIDKGQVQFKMAPSKENWIGDGAVDNNYNFYVTQPSTGYGMITTTSGSSTISGFGASTLFTKDFNVGTTITLNSTTFTILTITNDYTATVSPTPGFSGSYNYTINNSSSIRFGVYKNGGIEINPAVGQTRYDITTTGIKGYGVPRGTDAQRPTILTSTTPFRYSTDSTALEYGESVGTWRQVATREYARSMRTGGTVTSVGLSLPSIFSVSGSPVTSSGTLSASFTGGTSSLFLRGDGRWMRSLYFNSTDSVQFNITDPYFGSTALMSLKGFDSGFDSRFNFADYGYVNHALAVSSGDDARYNFDVSGGTIASPTALAKNNRIGGLYFRPYNGSSYRKAGYFGALVDSVSGSNISAKMIFGISRINSAETSSFWKFLIKEFRNISIIDYVVGGDVGIGIAQGLSLETAVINARLHVKGTGTTTGKTMLLEDSGGAAILTVTDNKTIQAHGYGVGAKKDSNLSKTRSDFVAGFATDGTVLDIPSNTELYNTITSTTSPQTLSSTRADNLINQGSTQATFTLNMPASPDDGQVCTITFNNAISTLTIDGNGETIVGSAVVTGVPGSQRKFKFYSGIGWIKLY